ncbi:hypothetical protein GCM10010399_17680 [Dactylosporangium fulvum]
MPAAPAHGAHPAEITTTDTTAEPDPDTTLASENSPYSAPHYRSRLTAPPAARTDTTETAAERHNTSSKRGTERTTAPANTRQPPQCPTRTHRSPHTRILDRSPQRRR